MNEFKPIVGGDDVDFVGTAHDTAAGIMKRINNVYLERTLSGEGDDVHRVAVVVSAVLMADEHHIGLRFQYGILSSRIVVRINHNGIPIVHNFKTGSAKPVNSHSVFTPL